jgi:hypothetical protein
MKLVLKKPLSTLITVQPHNDHDHDDDDYAVGLRRDNKESK